MTGAGSAALPGSAHCACAPVLAFARRRRDRSPASALPRPPKPMDGEGPALTMGRGLVGLNGIWCCLTRPATTSPILASDSSERATMPSQATNARTRQEWRELGFFYDRDDARRRWKLVGSRAGLSGFCQLLSRYVANPRNAQVSEHDHYGPYMYLKVMTWTEASLDDKAIAGRLEDLSRLSTIFEARLAAASPGQSFEIGREYAPASSYDLEVQVAADGLDPASVDPNCVDQAST
jgi:hypothetical protein